MPAASRQRKVPTLTAKQQRFVDAYVGDWHFWAFNVADAGISVGVALIVIDSLFGSQDADGEKGGTKD